MIRSIRLNRLLKTYENYIGKLEEVVEKNKIDESFVSQLIQKCLRTEEKLVKLLGEEKNEIKQKYENLKDDLVRTVNQFLDSLLNYRR